jgi:hypothetical protein
VRRISLPTFKKFETDIKYDFIMLGPSTGENHLNFNPDIIHEYKKYQDPLSYIYFVIAHELAHQVQMKFQKYKNISNEKTSFSGIDLQTIRQDSENFNILHTETDCLAQYMLVKAGFGEIKIVNEIQQQIYEECLPYRGQQFCKAAFKLRSEDMLYFNEQLESFRTNE